MNFKALGQICEVTAGQSAPQGPKVFGKNGKPFIRAGSLEHLVSGGSEQDCEHISDDDAARLGLRLFPKNTILFAKSGMSAKKGKVHRLRTHCYVVSHLAALVPGTEVDPCYLQRWFERHPPSRLIPNEAYPSIRISEISKIRIQLPPLFEQKRIASILDKADSIREKRRQTITKVDELLQSVFFDMFGDPVNNPMGWEDSLKLGDVAEIVSGITKGRKLNGSKTRNVPYLAVLNVQDRHLNLNVIKTIDATKKEIEKYRLLENDILLTEGGDPDKVGRGTLWKNELPECIYQNHIFRVRLKSNRLNPIYMNWLIGSVRGKSYFLKSAKQTTGIASINMTQLKNFPVLIPPMDLQKKFVSKTESIEKLKNQFQQHLSFLDSFFASLQQRAFNGEL